MAAASSVNPDLQRAKEEEEEECDSWSKIYRSYDELIETLPRSSWFKNGLILYQGCWFYSTSVIKGTMYTQQHLKTRPSDIFLTSIPKSGTTWLKSIIFAIMNRETYDINDNNHPLLTTNPHDIVPDLDLRHSRPPSVTDIDNMPSPRLFATHMPYSLLPKSIVTNNCRIVYVYRDPKDVFVSLFYFVSKLISKELPPNSFQESFNLFLKGISPYGPFWDHALGYHQASLTRPDTVLLLKYEDMQTDAVSQVKKVAEFLGQPISFEEESSGVVQGIVQLCSFERQSNLAVNKHEKNGDGLSNEFYYRKGKVGDSKNHLTTEMAERCDQITRQKLPNLF